MRLTVRCEECGWRQVLEREILWPQEVRLICHSCEAPLVVTFEKIAAWSGQHLVHV